MHIPHLSDIVQDLITAYHRLYSQLRQPNCPLLFARVCCTALAAGEVRGVIPARTWAVRAVVQRTTKRNQGEPSTRAHIAEEESAQGFFSFSMLLPTYWLILHEKSTKSIFWNAWKESKDISRLVVRAQYTIFLGIVFWYKRRIEYGYTVL